MSSLLIQELNRKLEAAREAYYAGEPILTDAEYDLAEAQLRGMSVAAPDNSPLPSTLSTVGTDAPGRIPHAHPMRSIQNIYTANDLIAWAEGLGWPRLTLESKWDGISASLVYRDGVLTKAVTRGDGDAGESILTQVMASHRIPQTLSQPVSIEVRGELVMRRTTLDRLNNEDGTAYVSTRNLVAGAMKLKDTKEVARRQVEFRPFEVLPAADSTQLANSALERRVYVASLGFDAPTPDTVVIENAQQLHAALAKGVASLNAPNPEIGRDGLVLKVDDIPLRENLGVGSKFANFQVAFKTQNAAAEATLLDVVWQTGRLGRLTPVGILTPVVLADATITRVTLNNLTWIETMGLTLGCRVRVVRSGDVIPQIVEVIHG